LEERTAPMIHPADAENVFLQSNGNSL